MPFISACCEYTQPPKQGVKKNNQQEARYNATKISDLYFLEGGASLEK